MPCSAAPTARRCPYSVLRSTGVAEGSTGGGVKLPVPPGCRLVAYDSLGSTSDEAKRLAAAGAAPWTVVWARTQTAGRGRRGRHWESPAGNLYASILLRPDCPPAAAVQLGFVAALAVADALAPVLDDRVGGGARLRLKWPNDVLLDGAKVAGILPETGISGGTGVDWVVVGIGINVADFPADTRLGATSLAAAGLTCTVEALLPALLRGLMAEVETWQTAGFGAVRAAWLKRAAPVGAPISVRLADGVVSGRFGGLDAGGALVLQSEAGERVVTAGEVFADGGR